MWPGQANSLEIREKLYDAQSEFQHVQVFETTAYGNLLVLDGCIQATERDEFAYQEMIAHLPLCALRQEPERVLIIGGGDGGALREVTRHQCVKKVEMAEIDENGDDQISFEELCTWWANSGRGPPPERDDVAAAKALSRRLLD